MVNESAWAGAAETVKYGVHLGMWTNWSRGRVMGATLTLSREDGNYLLAFTAFFIGLVSTRFWRIVCFILHNSLSASIPRDALYHQQQAVLRNSASVDSGLFAFCQLAWAWRRTARRAFVRVLPVIATAVFLTVAFTIAGGFSSSISTGIGNDVLLNGSNCAFINTEYPDIEATSMMQPYTSRLSGSAANYAQQCYSANTSGIFNCGTFVKPTIPTLVDNNAACPFGKGLCQSNASLRLDTGYINSHEHLGLNAPFDETVIFRTVLECAPLVTDGYSSNISTSAANYTAYHYGSDMSGNNYTLRTNALESQYSHGAGSDGELKVINVLSAIYNGSAFPSYSDFTPIPGLFSTEGDLMITFLIGNGVYFLDRADDPWYRATMPGRNITWQLAEGQSRQTFMPEQAASPLACRHQYQFCNAALREESRCGPLASIIDAQVGAAPLFNMTEDQMANNDTPDTPAGSRFVWFLRFLSLAVMGPDILINALGPNALASQQGLTRDSGLMGNIQSNQWQLDVQNWWAIYMASLQAGMVNTAHGTRDPVLEAYRIPPFNSYVQKLCNNQKILSTEYTSFSVFGISFIYAIGALIVAISYLMGYIQAWLYHHWKLNQHAYLQWTANETLQLQRMAYQGLGSGQWSRYTDSIPLTRPGELLADLSRSYPLDKDKKMQPDVEQGNLVTKLTGTTVTTVQVATPTMLVTDEASEIPPDDDSHVDQASVGGRQSVDSPGHLQQDDSVHPRHPPAVPNMDGNPRPPGDAALFFVEQPTAQVSENPWLVMNSPESNHGQPARVSTCPPVDRSRG